MKKGIAFFDFDGTITTKDTFLEFIRFYKGAMQFWIGFMLNSPFLLAWKLKLISNQDAKERVLRYFFKGTPVEEFRLQCSLFQKNKLPALIRQKALEEIRKLQAEGCVIVIVSASPENWICDWANEMNILLIASRLEIKQGKLTGRIDGKNCHGEEKVKRIAEKHVLNEYDVIYAYGDSRGDRPMLGIAGHSFYRPFRD